MDPVEIGGVAVNAAPVAEHHSLLQMVIDSSLLAQFVLLVLFAMSLMSWAIAIAKFLQYQRAKAHSKSFLSVVWETKHLGRIDDATRRFPESPMAAQFVSGYRELTHSMQEGNVPTRFEGDSFSTVRLALERSAIEEAHKLEKGLTFLATVASAAPFIGLFGTVWGIMNAFQGLGLSKASTLQAVAPGISEALVATAVGLAAAIPAAMAYNFFSASVRQFREQMGAFISEFIEVAKRQLAARS